MLNLNLSIFRTSFIARRLSAIGMLFVLTTIACLIAAMAPATKDLHTAVVLLSCIIALVSGSGMIGLITFSDDNPIIAWLKPTAIH